MANLFSGRLCWSIAEAERIKGSAPNAPEVIVVFRENYTKRVPYAFLNAFLRNLYYENIFYCDDQFLYFSLEGPDGSEERKTFE